MSASPTSPDHGLDRLVAEGYDAALRGGCLAVGDVPYVTRERRVMRGTIVLPLDMSGGSIAPPSGHQVGWAGDVPCHASGRPLDGILHENVGRLMAGLLTRHLFCARPVGGAFRDYHDLVTTFVAMVSGPASVIDPDANARTHRRRGGDRAPGDALRYADTASSRAGTNGLSTALAVETVGIVGVGGTGSWILDLVSKTPVQAIHLFDDDVFEQHTAFRSPGAAPLSTALAATAKVVLLSDLYGVMHRRIVPHRIRVSAETAPMLDVLTFAFVCVDTAAARAPITARLLERRIPFVDVGMGLHLGEGGVGGIVRTVLVQGGDAAAVRDHVPLEGEADDPYSTNIQTAELNALNATLAVIEWKRLRGFYAGGGGGSLVTVDPPALHALRPPVTKPEGAEAPIAAARDLP